MSYTRIIRRLREPAVFLFFPGLFIFIFLITLVGANVRAASSTLVISEVLYDPNGDEPGNEWIELVNLSAAVVDLSSYKIGDEEMQGDREGMKQFPGGAIAPGQVIVIAGQADAFAASYGFNPDYEINDTNASVPDMIPYGNWATGPMALANSGDEVLLLNGSDALVDAVSWGSSTWAFNPAAPDIRSGHSLERNPADVDTDSAGDWIDQATPNPGSVTTGGGGNPTPTATSEPGCGKTGSYLSVWEIQGSGDSSPYADQTVNNVRGIVTADFQNGTGGPFELWGFFIQAHETDCDAATSDGLFIYSGFSAKNISVGDLVEIDGGHVLEYQGPASFIWDKTLTELSCQSGCNVNTLQSGYGLPAAEEYDPPTNDASAGGYNEAREGMLVQVTVDSTAIAPNNEFNEFIVLRGIGQDRLHQEDAGKGQRIVVDGDGVAAARCGQNGFGEIQTFDVITYIPAGGSAIYGPLNYNFNTYKVQQDDDTYCIAFTAGDHSSYDPAVNPAPGADANTLTVASLNAWNFFDTHNDPAKDDDLPAQAEYILKSQKRAAAICNANGLNLPTIIGLQEVENEAVLQRLVDDVAATCGATYNFHTLAGPDDRSIEVAFLTRTDLITVMAVNDRQGCSATNWGVDYESGDHPPDITCNGGAPYYLFNRPPLHLEAQIMLDGSLQTVHVINNHFKSKLSSPSCSIPDCTDRRVEQAQHVDSLVGNILAGDPNAYIIVMGDLNDYYHSPPLDELDQTNGALTNVWDDLQGPPTSGQGTITRYSYIFNGVSQTLDHALISDALNALPRITSPRHINTDWPGNHLNDNSMFGSSDHDFLLVAYDFTGTGGGGGNGAMHIADLDGSSQNQGNKWTAFVTILVVDESGSPVANATVNGSWSDGASGTDACVTAGNGLCGVSKAGISRRDTTVVFTVDNVTHATLTYDSVANTDPDGDSNGTSITVFNP